MRCATNSRRATSTVWRMVALSPAARTCSMLKFLRLASHGQVMLSLFKETFPKLADGTILLLDEPEMALSVSNQRRILKMLMELVDQKKFRIICATHSPVLLESADTYVINLD